MSGRRAGAWLALGVLLCTVCPAFAGQATGEETTALAKRAASGDAAALSRLRTIDVIDGRPVALARALPTAVDAPGAPVRLRELARDVALGREGTGPATARADARTVLADDRFGVQHGAGPLYGIAKAIGRFLGWLLSPLQVFGALWWLPPTLLLLLAVAALSTAVAGRSRRRTGEGRGGLGDPRALADPAALEGEADEAERAGDHERALRLRFEAGLVRLDLAGAIRLRASTTSGSVRATLGPSRFDPLAEAHDDVVYGSREAGGDDLREARESWPRLLGEVGRR